MKHFEQTLATRLWNTFNICNILIYICNIHIKHLQHTSDNIWWYETLETYSCTKGEGEARAGWFWPQSGSRRRVAAREHHQHGSCLWVPLDQWGPTWSARQHHQLRMATGRVRIGWSLRAPKPETRNRNLNSNRKPIRVEIHHQNQNQTRGYSKPERIPETRMDTQNPRINIHIFTCINKRQ
jgi:hypothetical protein